MAARPSDRPRSARLSELGWGVKASCVSVLVGVECVCVRVGRPPVTDDPAEGGRMMVSVGSVDALPLSELGWGVKASCVSVLVVRGVCLCEGGRPPGHG